MNKKLLFAFALIGNGIETSSFKPVVRLDFNAELNGQQVKKMCTGTWITPRVILTAAHCVFATFPAVVDGKKKIAIKQISEMFVDGKPVGESRLIINPEIQEIDLQAIALNRTSAHTLRHDMALLVLKNPSSEQPVYHIQFKSPKPGTRVSLVGFGGAQTSYLFTKDGSRQVDESRSPGSGVKRYGTNVIASFNDELLAVNGTTDLPFVSFPFLPQANGVNVGIMHGDSGGPLLVATPQGTLEIAGVASMSFPLSKTTGKVFSVYAATSSPKNANWLQSMLQLFK